MIVIRSNDTYINYSPKNYVEDVMRNVSTILRTFKEEQPLNRGFGFDSDLIDKNIHYVENRITSHLLELFRKYEIRALLKYSSITLKEDDDYVIEIGIEVIE